MKLKILIIVCVALLSFTKTRAAFSKDTIPENVLTRYNELIKKSNHQQTGGWLLFGGGIAVGITGIFTAFRNTINDIGNIPTRQPNEHRSISKILMFSGLGLTLLSIPLIAAGIKNRKKAKLFMKQESLGINISKQTNQPVTSIGVKINF